MARKGTSDRIEVKASAEACSRHWSRQKFLNTRSRNCRLFKL